MKKAIPDMFMIEPRSYVVTVHKGTDYSILVCVVYFLDERKRDRGFEFYQRVTSFPQRPLPFGRQATFTEELRATDFAAHASGDPTVPDEQVITSMLRSAFGTAATFELKRA